jgi:hypothetical protein
MTKPKCAVRGCKDHHTLMSKFCLKHIPRGNPTEEIKVSEKKKTLKSVTKKKAAKKKAAKGRGKGPRTNKHGEKRGNLGIGNGTRAQKAAAKDAALYPRINWREEVESFRKGKKKQFSIELSTPGSAQVTRVRLVASDYCDGLLITTLGAEIIFAKGGA